MVEWKRTILMSHFGKLPRQDTPVKDRTTKELDAIEEARRDFERQQSKNEEAVTDTDSQ